MRFTEKWYSLLDSPCRVSPAANPRLPQEELMLQILLRQYLKHHRLAASRIHLLIRSRQWLEWEIDWLIELEHEPQWWSWLDTTETEVFHRMLKLTRQRCFPNDVDSDGYWCSVAGNRSRDWLLSGYWTAHALTNDLRSWDWFRRWYLILMLKYPDVDTLPDVTDSDAETDSMLTPIRRWWLKRRTKTNCSCA